MSGFLPQLVSRVKKILEPDYGPDYPVTTEVPSNQSAWLAVPVFAAAKQSGLPVADIAEEIAGKLRSLEHVQVTVSGGFVNVTPEVFGLVLNETVGEFSLAGRSGETVVIDFSSPNIAKPMSIGHLRSTIIGDSLRRINEFLGRTVVGINHIGDWGTQFGKLLVAYNARYGDLIPRPELTMQDLLALYVEFHESAEEDPDLDEAARAMFARLEAGNTEVRALWQSLVDASLREFQLVYDRLGVRFTEPKMGESFFEDKLEAIIALAKERGVADESDGALIIRVPGIETPLLLQKKDGATLYATRDLAAMQYRVEAYRPKEILYVVANEQALHFEQLFAAARLLGLVQDDVRLAHVKFGLVRLPDGKISTRKGRVVFLSDVLDEAVARARLIVDEKNPELPEAERMHIAEAVGVGAVKYFDLSHNRKHDIVFDWDRMLQLTGDSGPYLQYTYVRAAQILSKAAAELPREIPEVDLPEDVQRLVRELARFPLVIERAAADAAPHTLAQYLNELATQFSRFYENHPVLKAKGDERVVRLAIVEATAHVLQCGLGLLGIKTISQM